MCFGILIPHRRTRSRGVLIAGLPAAFPWRLLRFKRGVPVVKALPFSDLFGLRSDFLRNLPRRHRPAGIQPNLPGLVPFGASIARHASAPPFVCFSFSASRVRPEACKKRAMFKTWSVFGVRASGEDSAARFVSVTFHNTHFSRKNRQWVAILFFRETIPRNRLVPAEPLSQSVQPVVAYIAALPRAVIQAFRNLFPL